MASDNTATGVGNCLHPLLSFSSIWRTLQKRRLG
jgi:hypothetical protein